MSDYDDGYAQGKRDAEMAAAEAEYLRSIGYDAHKGHAKCTSCRRCVSTEEHGPFRDPLSFREFQISGLCQACQDAVFQPEHDCPTYFCRCAPD